MREAACGGFRQKLRVFLLVTAVTVGILAVLSIAIPWSPIFRWYDDVDLDSGRVRRVWIVMWLPVREVVSQSWISTSVEQSGDAPEWRRVNTFSPGLPNSPHHVYHGAIAQIHELDWLDRTVPFDEPAKAHVAGHVLDLWKQDGSYYSARDYIACIGAVVMTHHRDGLSPVRLIDVMPCCQDACAARSSDR